MQAQTAGHSGNFEYFFAARVHPEVCYEVKAEREWFFRHYGVPPDKGQAPYITVASFSAREQMEDTIISWLQRICSRQQSFEVMLNNFSGLPAHSIIIRVQDREPFQVLASQLRVIDEYVRSYDHPPACLSERPCLHVAKNLSPEVYDRALSDYTRREFNWSFTVDQLVLLRRNATADAETQLAVFGLLPQLTPTFERD